MKFSPEDTLRDIAKGDEAAYDFMCRFYIWFHAFDDLIDHDKPQTLRELLKAHFGLIVSLSCNEFYLKHKAVLLPVILSSSMSFESSEQLREDPDVLRRIASQVLKSQYQDIFFQVAWCVGGYDHMAAMNEKWRDFNFDPTPPPAAVP